MQQLDQLVEEARGISTDIGMSELRNSEIINEVNGMSSDFAANLRGPAEAALTGVIALAHSVEDLSRGTETGPEHDALVAKCKGQSVVVGKRFEDLHAKAHDTLERATKLAADITYQEATAQSRIKRVNEMLETSQAMQASEENVRAMRIGNVVDAEAHIRVAEQTRRQAQEKKEEAETARTLRNIFTFGLGEIGDWGGLNEAIDYAENLIRSANDNLSSCHNELAQSQANLAAINDELDRFSQLKISLVRFGPMLRAQADNMNEMTNRILDLENHSLDVGVFLSGLAGKASVLSVQHTAKQLAAKIRTVQHQIVTAKLLAVNILFS
ncbi:hypothetical protein K438DRAFT_2098016 [Mycena galopus ATCC 62051]|nr:hypothetical protein K438DRAFT_2098016 [Mycena galopus ATCC 62051]